MSQRSARVVAVDADHVWVETAERESGCGNCMKPGGCQTGLLQNLVSTRRYRVVNGIGAVAGDEVQLGVRDGALLHASLIAYLVPALLVILGAALGQWTGGDSLAVLGALAGLLVGGVYLRRAGQVALEKQGAVPMLSIQKSGQVTCNFMESK